MHEVHLCNLQSSSSCAKLKQDFVPAAPSTMALPYVNFFFFGQTAVQSFAEVQTIPGVKKEQTLENVRREKLDGQKYLLAAD